MKVLHVGASNFAPGGVATYVEGVVAGQRARGHEVHLAELWPRGRGMAEVPTALDSLAALRELREALAPDVVHLHALVHSYAEVGAASVMTAHEHAGHCASGGRYLEGSRRVCDRSFGWVNCLWGHYVDRCGSRHPRNVLARFQVTREAPSFAGHWIAPSAYSRDQLLRRGMDSGHVHHVPNPLGWIDETVPPHEESGPRFLFLGRLVPNKGCDVLLEAMASVPRANLSILGEGPERAGLEAKSRDLGLDERVSFLGWASAQVVARHLRASRALVVPSVWPEPFGLVALEAYREGCAVVASRVGGLADLVRDGLTGILVPPGDPASLARALESLVDAPEAADAMGRRGHAMALEGYRMEPHLEALDAVYDRARGVP